MDIEMDVATGGLANGLATDGLVRVIAVEVSAIADHARRTHRLSGPAAALCAQAIAATALMSAHVKGEERLSLQLQASRPRFAFIGDVDGLGKLRARLTPAVLPSGALGSIDGYFLAIKSVVGREIYRGVSEVRDESIADALRRYLAESNQADAALALIATIDEHGAVEHALGLLVERLPADGHQEGLSTDDFFRHWDFVNAITATELASAVEAGVIRGNPVKLLEHRHLVWSCGCAREKVEGMLISLGRDTLIDMRDQDGRAEVTCNFCQNEQVFSREQLQSLIDEIDALARPVAES